MKFSEIHPFLRFARIVDSSVANSTLKPYDCRLFYVLNGAPQILIQDTLYTLSANDTIIINAGTKYRIIADNNNFKILAFNFDYNFENCHLSLPIPPDFAENFDESNIISPVSFSDFPEFNTVVYIENTKIGSELLFSAFDEYKKKLLMSDSISSSYISRFLALCVRKKEDSAYTENNTASKIISYVQQNIGNNITNIEIAQKFNYHPNYINTLIRSKTGMPLHKYLIHIRIQHAIELLETTDMSISEISQKAGFCDISYFSNYFKKVTGRSPKFYRKK